MRERLYEDADRYCMLWLGILMMTAYYFEFLFKIHIGELNVNLVNLTSLFAFPPLVSFFIAGYFIPDRGKKKNVSLAIGVFLSLMYFISSFVVYPWSLDDAVWYAFWGIGSAIVVAGGAAMIALVTRDEAYSPGIMDTSKLGYVPPPAGPIVEIEAMTVESTEDAE